jgi:hypothetical protein
MEQQLFACRAELASTDLALGQTAQFKLATAGSAQVETIMAWLVIF